MAYNPNAQGLADSLPTRSIVARQIAYNNTLDRIRMELPPSGDPGASGVVQIDLTNWPNGLPVSGVIDIVVDEVDVNASGLINVQSSSGTPEIPVLVDYVNDSITVVGADPALTPVHASGIVNILSASGTSPIPVYLEVPIPVAVSVDIETDAIKVFSASGDPAVDVHLTDVAHKEDDAHITGDWGVPVLAVRNDNIGTLSSANGDYENIQLNAYGDVRTQIDMVRDVSIDIGDGFASTGTIRVAVASGVLNQERDNVRIYSASGTTSIPVYIADEPVDVHETSPAILSVIEKTWSQLTGPSSTPSQYTIASKHTFQYTIASIDTSVDVAASGSLDNTNWFNLDSSGVLTARTVDGTYGMTFDGMTKYVLFSFMEEVGGANATIDVKYLGGH